MKLTHEELDTLLARGGLELAEPYRESGRYRKDDWILTRCRTCGTCAHYRLKYVQDKIALKELSDELRAERTADVTTVDDVLIDQLVCRACYWREWYFQSDALYQEQVERLMALPAGAEEDWRQSLPLFRPPLSWNDAEALAARHGYELVELLGGYTPNSPILVVRCKACGRRSAMRPDDVTFGCSCRGKR